jgi:hypothetical protein
VLAFENADDAFAYAVSMEARGAMSAGTVAAPDHELLHLVDRRSRTELAA